jgi:UDPglucose 6-dehydrogenase
MGGDAAGRTVALLGLTFKPNTDDMRDSPSIDIVEALQAKGVTVRACDPEGIEQARSIMPSVEFFDDPYEAMKDADAAVLVTEWDAYRALDLERVRGLLAKPVFVDLRNVYTPSEMKAAGLSYTGVGRASTPGSIARTGDKPPMPLAAE